MINRDEYLKKLLELKDIQIIKVITGIRRSGKSTILKMFREKLVELKVDESHIIEMNFEDPDNLKIGNWGNLYNTINEKIVDKNKYYVFFDEIQNINEFEKAVDGLYIKDNVDIYITGSNAYTLSSDLATILTGRYIVIKMLPLSFKEYVGAYSEEKNVNKLYLDFINYGSFPQTIQLSKINKELIKNYLDDIYNSILFKDVITKNKIADSTTLEKVCKFLYDNIGNFTSTKKISDSLITNSSVASNKTVDSYITALIKSYLVYKVNRYDIKGKDFLRTQEKYYVPDVGLRYNLLGQSSSKDYGHILENIIYLELLRRNYKVYIGKVDEYEVDFVAINELGPTYIQVALTTREDNVLKRELRSLQKINDAYPKILLTLDDDLETNYDGIKKINALKWLLNQND